MIGITSLELPLIQSFSRIFMAFGINRLLQAFRKHSKNNTISS